jgi:hypothetical protein
MGISLPLQDLGEDEAERHLKYLPAYEREIVRRLSQGAPIYWACRRTPSTINRLIEGPLGTVACVIKPPGSALEFEIKRTGVGGAFPLTAIFTGFDGNPVPPSHRLRAGASTASLRWEGEHAAILSMVYRIAHGSEASISKLLTLAGYRTVPCAGREVHLVDYFTDSKIFGPEYSKMRGQMKLCVAAFDQQYGSDFTHLPGEVGLTGQFLYHVLPCQGLLAQTTSFRLDTLAGYLSADGADIYFRRGLNKASFSPGEARRFADALLDEVLGIYCAPDVRYVDHAQYIAAAFAVPENRRRADRLHAEAAFDLGRLWGTVLALGGFTDGESFVGRNLGLKSRFTEGEWTSQLISMDHDNLHIPDEEDEVFWAQGALRSAVMDEAFIRGNPRRPKQVPRSSLHFLERIYHLEYDDAADRSRRSLEAGMTTACQQTRRALAGDPRLARLFSPDYLRHLRDWHTVAADYLNSVRLANEADFAAWQERTQAYLAERNYSGDLLVNYCRALEKHSDFVRRYSFLYLPAQP